MSQVLSTNTMASTLVLAKNEDFPVKKGENIKVLPDSEPHVEGAGIVL